MTTPKSNNERQSILNALTGLTPAGFEILICDALAEMTGSRVRRARAGDQAGRDGRADSELGASWWSASATSRVGCRNAS